MTSVGGSSLAYDLNGNVITDEAGRKLTYDAWNRLVQVAATNSCCCCCNTTTVLAAYSYDALGRRIKETHGSTTTDLYYSNQWQVLEETQGTTVITVTADNVRSPVYVDALVLVKQIPNCGPTQLLYVQQDANWNVTAVVNSAGVQQRFVYTPFGVQTVLTASWGTTLSSAQIAYGHQGLRLDIIVGSMDGRNRIYDPVLQRWLQMDPAATDSNLYRYVFNNPVDLSDPSGLEIPHSCPNRFGRGNRYSAEEEAEAREADMWAGPRRHPGAGLGSTVKARAADRRARSAAEVWAAKATITGMIDDIWTLGPAKKEEIKKAVIQLVDAAQFPWDKRTGYFGFCDKWCEDYLKVIEGPRAKMAEEGLLFYYVTIDYVSWSNNARWNPNPKAGHNAIRVAVRDGPTFYLDDGNVGGVDHVFMDNEIPGHYKPTFAAPWFIPLPAVSVRLLPKETKVPANIQYPEELWNRRWDSRRPTE